ncbi:MAG: hypothetical protein Q9163_003956 [Psora crenata]
MDPLSISASITTLLELTSAVIKYMNDVKGAGKDRQKVLIETSSTSGMLYMLRDQAEEAKEGDPWLLTLRSLNVPKGPIEQFKDALQRLAEKLAPVEGLKKVGKSFAWPFQKGEVMEILHTIERQKTLFIMAHQNDYMRLSKAIKDDIRNLQHGVTEVGNKLDKLQISQIANSFRCPISANKRDTDQSDEKIRQWLAAPDPSSSYNKALKQRQPGTGTWLLKSDEFGAWKTTSASFLWLHGIPGCGKTILSSTIIQAVLDYCNTRPALAVMYFYFEFTNIEKQGHEKMIRSLTAQLASQCSVTPSALELLHSSCRNGERQPTLDQLLDTLHKLVKSFEKSYLILDALDECSDREALLDDIEEFAGWEDVDLHILSISRRENDIEDRIRPLAGRRGRVPIQGAHVNDDILAYVHERLQNDPRLKRWRNNTKAQQEIENSLTAKADGILLKALASLPKTLDDTYTRILCNIDDSSSQDAFKILQWLTFSARPLRLEEISEVIAIDADDSTRYNTTKIFNDRREILTICPSLISLVEESPGNADENIDNEDTDGKAAKQVVQLAHLSVKEFLISGSIRHSPAKDYSIQEISANTLIAKDCIAYLLEFDEVDPLTHEIVEEYPLALYAAGYWSQHAAVAERHSGSAIPLSMDLLVGNGRAFPNWVRLYHLTFLRIYSEDYELLWMYIPLYYASFTGLIETVKLILDRETDPNAQSKLEYIGRATALSAASARGHYQIVQILLDKGADINASKPYTALELASFGGYYQVDTGFCGLYRALCAASARGLYRIVQTLIDMDAADSNAQGPFTALQLALIGGHYQIVQTLLDRGADINAHGSFTALQLASLEGHYQLVQTLLDRGADINAHGPFTALQLASLEGHHQIVQTLLDRGADINAHGPYTALQLALTGGHHQIVQALVGKGADI